MSKFVKSIIIVIGISSLLAGCASKGNDEAAQNSTVDKKVATTQKATDKTDESKKEDTVTKETASKSDDSNKDTTNVTDSDKEEANKADSGTTKEVVADSSNESSTEDTAKVADNGTSASATEATEITQPTQPTEESANVSSNTGDNGSIKQMYINKLNNLAAQSTVNKEQTTKAMADAGSAEYSQWDGMLNEIYSKVKEGLSGDDANKLVQEEQAWIGTRDQKADDARNQYKGGSFAPINALLSLIQSTKSRCYELVEKLDGAQASATTESGSASSDIGQKVKNYILNGQGNKSEAEKVKWSSTFLDQVDISSLYNQYLAADGKADDMEALAKYITDNAPIQGNWKDLFSKDLENAYGVKDFTYEDKGNGMYQIYVKKDGKDVPYVTVSARTGYFHG